MYQHNILRACGIATGALFILTSSVAAQPQQKPAKEMIQGKIHRLRHDPRRRGWGKEIGEPLNYTFQFGTVMDHFPDLLSGAALTIR